ncbi:MAG: hypothetical protein K8S54_19470 [Spirochaetia bacterium]|nr:hypothetical protein [Spirochaetia bacterium]
MPEEKRTIRIQALNEEAKAQLRQTFEDLERKLKIDSLALTLFYVVMELVGNAVKANLKRVFFKDRKYDLTDPEDYRLHIDEFKVYYNSVPEEEYTSAFQNLGLSVTIDIDLNHRRLLIFVENNANLHPEEERRIRAKLASTREMKDIIDFSVQFADETEGKGLGLAMIVLLIRDLGFDPSFFRVYKKEGGTVARLEFPLSADYTPIRSRHPTTFS